MHNKTIDYVLRATWQAIAKMYNEEASKYGTTMATGFTLLSIDPIKGTPSTALGPKMGMESTSLSRTLKVMEQKGLVFRVPHPDDGRSVIIKLTPNGLKKRNVSKDYVLRFNDKVNEVISDDKIKVFNEVSEKILELIQSKLIYSERVDS